MKPISTISLAAAMGMALLSSGLPAHAATQELPPAFRSRLLHVAEAQAARPSAKAAVFGAPAGIAGNSAVAKALGLPRQGAAAAAPAEVLAESDELNFLDGPDGKTWFYTSKYDVETTTLPGGMATTNIIRGFSFTVYDSEFKEIGTITDKVTLAEGEVRTASVQLMSTVTRKFFNFDNKYELGVSIINNTADYTLNISTKIYSIGGKKDTDGHDLCIQTIPGQLVEVINAGKSAYEEQYLMTFLEERRPDPNDFAPDDYLEFLKAYTNVLSTYKFASYAGGGQAEKIQEVSIPLLNMPGDTMASPCMFMKKDGDKIVATYVSYEKPFLNDPTGTSSDEGVTPDNNLQIDVYTLENAYASKFELAGRYKIATTQYAENIYSYYSLGDLLYDGDIDFSLSGDGTPTFFVTRADFVLNGSEDYTYYFYRYDSEGRRTDVIGEGLTGFITMSDVKGMEPQKVFLSGATEEDIVFNFVNIHSGNVAMMLPLSYEGNKLTATIDRVADGRGACNYAVKLATPEYDKATGSHLELVAWIDSDGQLLRTDRVNVGKDLAIAQLNIVQYALDPYLFDTDDNMEYMVLAKRYTGSTDSSTREELLISGAGSAEPLFSFVSSDENGTILSVNLVNTDTNTPRLALGLQKGDTYRHEFYSVPFRSFAEGDGSVENPYMIASAGDFRMIGRNTSAHYALARSIDASGTEFAPVSGFSGSLDGRGHSIKGLKIAAQGSSASLFSSTSASAEIKNLTFINPEIELCAANRNSALIAGTASGAKISGINVYGLKVTNPDAAHTGIFGTLAGTASSGTEISASTVLNASLCLPGTVGGIVGDARTGSSVAVCAFTGSIDSPKGDSAAGIVAEAARDIRVADCHTNADIRTSGAVGSIIAVSERATVTRCLAEGSIESTGEGKPAGGIIGHLAPFTTSSGDSGETVEETDIVFDNVVALKTIKGVAPTAAPSFPGQYSTIHRIVGYSVANREPDEESPASTEEYIRNNYALAPLAVVDASVAEGHKSTEGQTITAEEFGRDFLEGINFAFGSSSETPWQETGSNSAALHTERTIVFAEDAYTAVEGRHFLAELHVLAYGLDDAEAITGDLVIDFDENLLSMVNMTFDKASKKLILEFACLGEGVSTISATLAGTKTEAIVTGVSGIDAPAIGAPSVAAISFDGSTVSAKGCIISLYSLQGLKLAEAAESLSVDGMAAGVYVACATATDGSGSSVIKVAIR